MPRLPSSVMPAGKIDALGGDAAAEVDFAAHGSLVRVETERGSIGLADEDRAAIPAVELKFERSILLGTSM